MAITLRHDAAAVALPSSSSQRKYGQNLVLQQQQQKYNAQQAGYDRLFDAYKQQNQNAFAWNQAADNRAFQANQQKAQNNFLLGRDQAKFDQQQQQQRKADFDAARNRIDTHAKDMLANGEITDPAARQRIQNLIAGKTIVMGSGFDETARQNYLDQYNAELAKILSEVPPAKPKPPPQPNFHTDQNGNQWVESGPGKWEQVPQEKSARPLDFNEYYNAEENKGKFDKDLDATMQSMKDAAAEGENPGKVTEEAALEEMKRRYEFRQKALGLVGDPTAAPELAGQAAPTSSPLQSILEQPTAAPAGIPITPPDEGVPPSPVAGKKPLPLTSNSTSQWADLASADQQPSQQAPQGMSAEQYHAEMIGKGYKLVTPTDGGRPYYLGDWGGGLKPDASGAPTSPAPTAAQEQAVPAGGSPTVASQSSNQAPVAPNFKSLSEGAANDAERAVVSQVEEIYKGQSPDVKAAISVALDPNALDTEIGQALIYLKEKGIDMNALGADAEKSSKPGERAKGRMRDKYGSSYDSF